MTWFEVVLAAFNNLHELFVAAAIILGIGGVLLGGILLTGLMEEGPDNGLVKRLGHAWTRVVVALVAAIALACIPTTSQLWQVRIDLLKLQLASPENVQAGAEHIAQLAKDLECKYLAHCETGKKQ